MAYGELGLPEDKYPLEKEKEINLARGDLNFLTPNYIIEAAYDAMKEGFTHYIYRYGKSTVRRSIQGLPELQEAVCAYYSKYNVLYEPEEVMVTNGSAIALYIIFNRFLKTGDEVILTDPTYAGYFRILNYLKAKIVYVPLIEEEGFRLDSETLRGAVTPKTKLIVICNPLNPAGKVFTDKELIEVADVTIENDLMVLSDEIYNEFVWGGRRHFAITSIDGMKERTMVVQSFSKTFAMTGWRLGYIMTSKEIIQKISEIPVNYAAATFIQRAGATALRKLHCHDIWGPPTHIELWRRELLRRLKFFHKELNDIEGIDCQFPEATFYLWPNFRNLGITTDDFVKLIAEKNVKMDPGTRYGPSGEGHARFGMVQPYYYIEEAARRIKDTLKSLRY